MRAVDERLDSPFHLVRSLVDKYRSGDLSNDDFLEALDLYDEKLQVLYEGVAADPGLFEVEEDPETIVDGQSGIQAFSDAADKLRDYAETGNEQQVTEALELARGAHERWVELIEVRGDLLSLLETLRLEEAGLDAEAELW